MVTIKNYSKGLLLIVEFIHDGVRQQLFVDNNGGTVDLPINGSKNNEVIIFNQIKPIGWGDEWHCAIVHGEKFALNIGDVPEIVVVSAIQIKGRARVAQQQGSNDYS